MANLLCLRHLHLEMAAALLLLGEAQEARLAGNAKGEGESDVKFSRAGYG